MRGFMTKRDHKRALPSRNYLFLYISLVVGSLNVLLSLTGLVDNLVQWHSWFEEGALRHYRDIRDYVFGWLPFRPPSWAKDLFILWSGLAFWSVGAFRALSAAIVQAGGRPFKLPILAALAVPPLTLLGFLRTLGRLENAAATSIRTGGANIEFPGMGISFRSETDKAGDPSAAYAVLELAHAGRFSFIAIPTLVIFAFVGLLFVASDLIGRF
jgi:hypothetical protein